MKTLLEQAKALSKKKPLFSNQEYELGLAWVKGEISSQAIFITMKYKNINSVNVLLTRTFKRYYIENNIKKS